MSQDVDYDVSSLSAITHMGISPGKGAFTTVNQVFPELVSAGLSPVVNGGAVYSRDRIMKRYLCIVFIVTSVFVVRSDESVVSVALTAYMQDK